ncbi:MAG TPA: EAL domain-containing protein, partial [Gammaproteobacteria bacterium]|nr:EAL domain-containing protein [Gammaproteobacteria bacterium]
LPIELFDAEITETVLLSNSVLTENVIQELKESGLTFSVDDFGTGYSSYTHLKLLPLRAIKIDKSFIKNIITDVKDTIIVESIIEIGQRMNIDVVAEGIETQEQLDFLLHKNCKKGQGYLLCPPLSAEKMSILLKNSVLK